MFESSIFIWDATALAQEHDGIKPKSIFSLGKPHPENKYLPKTFEDAIRICESIIDLPKTETTNPKFVQLTDYLETVAKKDQYSPDYNMNFYHATQRTIEHNQKKENNGQFLEIYRSYELLDPTEVLSVIQKKNKELKLVVLDSLGMLILPNGDTYPEELKKHLKRYPVKLQEPSKEGLPKRRADFIKQYKSTIDNSLAKLGYVENFDIRKHSLQPDKVADTLYYVKQTKHGFNIVYVDIDSGMDANGSYTLESGVTFYLNKTVELAKEFCRFEIEGGDIHNISRAALAWVFFEKNYINNAFELKSFFNVLHKNLVVFNEKQCFKELKALYLQFINLSKSEKQNNIFFNHITTGTISNIINALLLLKKTNNNSYEKVKNLIYEDTVKEKFQNFVIWDSQKKFKDIYPKLTQAIDAIEPKED